MNAGWVMEAQMGYDGQADDSWAVDGWKEGRMGGCMEGGLMDRE